MANFFLKLLGDANERKIKAVRPLLHKINSLEAEMIGLTDEQLKGKTVEFRERLAKGATLDDLLPEAFATVREAGKRVLGMRHFDVQMLGGIYLHKGQISEMRTGEGKTLVATLPAYLNALSGHGVHVVSVNDYLVKRDSEWMGRIYRFLGLEVGLIQHHLYPAQRRIAYGADITYCTNNELGFDYLRDNMATSIDDCVLRELNYAIVDEVDSILIDEARTPLIISGQVEQSADLYKKLQAIAPRLTKEKDYTVDEKAKNIIMTEEGISHSEKLLGVKDLFDVENPELSHQVIQALRAKELYRRDIEYVVKNNPENGIDEVVIVDEFTGRLMIGRRYSDGLHQAIEAKEQVKIQDETQTLATITFQNFFRLYKKLAGMTGTAATEEAEFGKIYSLEVTVIPTNKPMIRKDSADVVYKTVKQKFKSAAEEIVEMHKKGKPVLVGTISIEKSEYLSGLLKDLKIPHSVLNAKYHEQEAKIVAQAGRFGGVTIATNMAGRGTDIVLGGNFEGMVMDALARQGHTDLSEAPEEVVNAAREEALKTFNEEREKVVQAGGLHIMGTERHESRRIDNQLRGRAARQGDPGSTKFYLSLEDDLMRLFGGDRISKLMDRMKVEEDMAIEAGMVTKAIANAQHKVEIYHFNIRKQVLEYDDVMNQQRSIIYRDRRKVLEGENLRPVVLKMIEKYISDTIDAHIHPQTHRDEWDVEGARGELAIAIPMLAHVSKEELDSLGFDEIKRTLSEAALTAYESKEAVMDLETLRQIERYLMLRIIDSKWIDHLHDMDSLREGIGLRAYGQKDPLQEYKREAYDSFNTLMSSIQHDFVAQLFHIQVVYNNEPPMPRISNIRESFFDTEEEGDEEEGPAIAEEVPGRNELCPCGSGKKFKKCCAIKS